jgi:hypothetical protein
MLDCTSDVCAVRGLWIVWSGWCILQLRLPAEPSAVGIRYGGGICCTVFERLLFGLLLRYSVDGEITWSS